MYNWPPKEKIKKIKLLAYFILPSSLLKHYTFSRVMPTLRHAALPCSSSTSVCPAGLHFSVDWPLGVAMWSNQHQWNWTTCFLCFHQAPFCKTSKESPSVYFGMLIQREGTSIHVQMVINLPAAWVPAKPRGTVSAALVRLPHTVLWERDNNKNK